MKLFLAALTLIFATAVLADTHVKGYYKKNGTYVEPHYRSPLIAPLMIITALKAMSILIQVRKEHAILNLIIIMATHHYNH